MTIYVLGIKALNSCLKKDWYLQSVMNSNISITRKFTKLSKRPWTDSSEETILCVCVCVCVCERETWVWVCVYCAGNAHRERGLALVTREVWPDSAVALLSQLKWHRWTSDITGHRHAWGDRHRHTLLTGMWKHVGRHWVTPRKSYHTLHCANLLISIYQKKQRHFHKKICI
jgi:hypothetical protein